MRRAWPWILATVASLSLVGCDEDGSKQKQEAQVRVAEPAPYEVKSEKAADLPPDTELKDSVAAAAPVGGRGLFDGEKTPSAMTPDPKSGGVLARNGPDDARRAQALINAPARKNTLKVSEPPSPNAKSDLPASDKGTTAGSAFSPSNSDGSRQAKVAFAAAGAAASPSPDQPRILFLGDSLSTRHFGFGPAMYEKLTKEHPGAQVDFYAYGGSSPMWFLPKVRDIKSPNVYAPGHDEKAPAPKLDKVLTKGTKVVIVELGTNLIDWTSINSRREGKLWGLESVRQMAQLIHDNGSACLWIGPPDMTGAPGKSDPEIARESIRKADEALAKAVASSCVYIKSSDKTRYAGGDGIHQNAKAGKAWAEALAADPLFKLP